MKRVFSFFVVCIMVGAVASANAAEAVSGTAPVAAPAAVASAPREVPGWGPLGLALLANPMQIPSEAHSVYGVMLNVGYGKMENVYLLEAGLFNQVVDTMAGVQAGVSNRDGVFYGLQAGVANVCDEVYGIQVGLVNVAWKLHGIQLGLVNVNVGGTPFFPIINVGF